jgi:hypothetical protein
MNQKIVSLVVFFSLFCLAGFVLAEQVTIPNPLSVTTFGGPNGLLMKIADGVGMLIGALGTIMLIVAGILYLISAGSPEKLGTAKKALIYAIAGIAVGAAATAIVSIIQGVIGVSGTT